MFYLGEIISFAIFCVIFCGGWVGLYLIIRRFHQKWKWEDQVHQNIIRKGILEELDIQYEVNEEGFIKPIIRDKRAK